MAIVESVRCLLSAQLVGVDGEITGVDVKAYKWPCVLPRKTESNFAWLLVRGLGRVNHKPLVHYVIGFCTVFMSFH
jgi:hypothetical protein